MNHEKDLKLFAGKLFLFTLPVLLLLIMSVALDPFRIYREYDDYDQDNFIPLNREFVCLKLYQRNSKSISYNSFIFGNSRSQAFKVRDWQPLLPANSKAFHFDGAGGGIYGVYNRIRYIDETGGKLENVLVLVDQYSLTSTRNPKGHLFISPPQLSKESPLAFYSEFTKPLLNLKCVTAFLDYSINRTHRNYTSKFIPKTKYANASDDLSGDVYYGYDRMIWEDEEGYYQALMDKGVFYDRSRRAGMNRPATREEAELLAKIRKVFDRHGTDYRIVVSPLYEQVPLGKDHLRLLHATFDAVKVYDYSGVNRFTRSIHNYYEESHFRPGVASQIMKEIYSQRGSR